MCVKTKTDFGCGCYKKALSICDNAPDSYTPCSSVDKYRYLVDGDCKDCRAAGDKVTRGVDGQGRYAKEIAAREKKSKRHSMPRAVLGEITGNGSQADSDNHGGYSSNRPLVTSDPWMKAKHREKEWESPHRQHADEGWVREHADRKVDIESLAQSHSRSPTSTRRRPSRRATDDYERDERCRHYLEVADSLVGHHQRRNSGSVQQQPKPLVSSSHSRGSRHGSYESVESAGTMSRGRSRTTPYNYGYATNFGYSVETRVPKDTYEGPRHRRNY
jgi:hypothetical protein